MLRRITIMAGTAGLMLALAGPSLAQAAPAAPTPPGGHGGGMVAVPKGKKASVKPGKATWADTPSCGAVEFPGNAGKISVQTGPGGTIAWGIYMYDPSKNDGPWTVDVFVGSRRVDHKNQNYAPHGSVSPGDATRGETFHIEATHTDLQGNFYTSVPNACVIP
jgi:hypothetical protein